MSNVPEIVTGLFDVFVPGTFLLVNLVLVLYRVPVIDKQTTAFIKSVAKDSGLVAVYAVLFGYLIGILLRLLRTEHADNWSAAWLRAFHPHACVGGRGGQGSSTRYRRWAREAFPYLGWIGELCRDYLPEEANRFYERTWKPILAKRRRQNRQFLNFSKLIVGSEDQTLAKEISSAEALNRYISAMCYALIISTVLVAGVVVWNYAWYGTLMLSMIVLAGLYLVAIGVILGNLRFSRIKEVETVFAACYKHRALFEDAAKEQKNQP